MSAINQTACQIREVAFTAPVAVCDRCHQPALRYSTAERMAIDIDLEHPILLGVTVSVHHCLVCQHYFRIQPPFLRPDAIYSNRVVDKAVQSVFRDGMAMRCVCQRLAADFWVQPSEGMIRRWCAIYGDPFDIATDYQPWVTREFSGILCVDEAYQGELALLLAVDPAAPDGDRLIGYQLVHGDVGTCSVEGFLARLKDAGIEPDQVITDGSVLYPAVLSKIWPQAAHQLCLFHETRRVTAAVLEVIKALRKQLPSPPPVPGMGRGGPLRHQPPSDDPNDPATKRWHWRQATRRAAIAEVHALADQGLGQRAIARQTGHHRKTVKRWLQQEPEFILTTVAPDAAPAPLTPACAGRQALQQKARRDKLARVHALAKQGHSYSAIARLVGIHRVTVKQWLQRELPAPEADLPVAAQESTEQAPPPAPWSNWEEVREVREALKKHRFLLLRRPEHLTANEQMLVTSLLEKPFCASLRTARSFLIDWYRLYIDENQQRRPISEAQSRFEAWRTNTTYAAIPALKRIQDRLTPARFESLSQFLHHPDWEATNNGAERAGRAFRHRQAPHFNLRKATSIERSIVVTACMRKKAVTAPSMPRWHTCQRGRRNEQATEVGFLLILNQQQEVLAA